MDVCSDRYLCVTGGSESKIDNEWDRKGICAQLNHEILEISISTVRAVLRRTR